MLNLTGTISYASFDSKLHTECCLNILNQSKTIESLNLSSIFFTGDSVVDLIVDMLQRNNKLFILKLSNASISYHNSKIFGALGDNKNLCKLYLSSNYIDTKNIDYIFRFLNTSAVIKIFDSSYNSKKISNSTTNIFETLSPNETLHTLHSDNYNIKS
jgi:hypothetical protein